ncbi:hypothetical protein M0804_011292 [Polistes exclamans]|nr:hypothetical protein M0804_011292 [Polistes exclamans]
MSVMVVGGGSGYGGVGYTTGDGFGSMSKSVRCWIEKRKRNSRFLTSAVVMKSPRYSQAYSFYWPNPKRIIPTNTITLPTTTTTTTTSSHTVWYYRFIRNAASASAEHHQTIKTATTETKIGEELGGERREGELYREIRAELEKVKTANCFVPARRPSREVSSPSRPATTFQSCTKSVLRGEQGQRATEEEQENSSRTRMKKKKDRRKERNEVVEEEEEELEEEEVEEDIKHSRTGKSL